MPGMTLRKIGAALLGLGLLLLATLWFGAPTWARIVGAAPSPARAASLPFVPLDTPSATATATASCGLGWRIVPNPAPNGFLYDTAATAPNDVWAVGNVNSQTLTLRWDGIGWSRVPSPSLPGFASHLMSVSAASADD